jgi:hypothetical protein
MSDCSCRNQVGRGRPLINNDKISFVRIRAPHIEQTAERCRQQGRTLTVRPLANENTPARCDGRKHASLRDDDPRDKVSLNPWPEEGDSTYSTKGSRENHHRGLGAAMFLGGRATLSRSGGGLHQVSKCSPHERIEMPIQLDRSVGLDGGNASLMHLQI